MKLPTAKQRGRYASLRKKGMPKRAAARISRSRNRRRKNGRGRRGR